MDVVRPAASLAPVLDAVAAAARAAGRDPAGVCVSKGTHRGGEEVLYTRAEVVAGVSDYIRMNALTDPADPTRVVLDPTLTDALYRNAKKTAAGYPTGVSKQEASAQALSQCAPWHIVRCGDTSVGHPGVVVPIEIVVKALQGGKKHMTFVRNCQARARGCAVVGCARRCGRLTPKCTAVWHRCHRIREGLVKAVCVQREHAAVRDAPRHGGVRGMLLCAPACVALECPALPLRTLAHVVAGCTNTRRCGR